MNEPPSPLLKSRIPRKTILVDRNLWELCFVLYVSKFETIVHLADSQVTNLEFATFIVLFERESFITSGTVGYSSATFTPPENMRLIHMPLIGKVVYNSLCLQATDHWPEISVRSFTRNFACPHQRQSDPTICKVLRKVNFRILSSTPSTPLNLRHPLR